ncbi:MAG: hypothetical protein K2Z81_27900, partial [Cyanobacteria bacterium]|nr:hypothetical protein [Cyanobacteriota bacterium]
GFNIVINSAGGINAAGLGGDIVTTPTAGVGGAVNWTASGGAINYGTRNIVTTGNAGQGGNVTLSSTGAGAGITGGSITTDGGSPGGDITIDSSGDVSVGSLSAVGSGGFDGGNIHIGQSTAPTNIAVLGTIDSSSDTGDAGNVLITEGSGNTLTMQTTAPVAGTNVIGPITATGAGGGTVSVTNTGTGGITLSGNATAPAVNAQGNITLVAGAAGATTASIVNAGAGFNLAELQTPGTVTLNANNGGDIGAAASPILTRNATGLTINTDNTGTGSAYVSNAGGSNVALTITNLSNNLQVRNTQGGNITLPASIAPARANGSVDVQIQGAAGNIVSSGAATAITTNSQPGNGGDVTLSTFDGNINLGTGAITASGNTAPNIGGLVTITSGTSGAGNITTGAISADAVGAGNNSGNRIVITANGGSTILIGGTLSAVSPASAGGNISVQSLGTNGNIQVNGNITVAGALGSGIVTLAEDNSVNPFEFNTGASNTNTVSGNIVGGLVNITNSGSAPINFLAASPNAVSGTVAGTVINVTAGSLGTVAGTINGTGDGTTTFQNGALSGSDINLTAHASATVSGTIGTATTQVIVNPANSLTFAASTASDNAGDAFITDISAGNMTLNATPGSFGRNLSYSKVNGGNINIGTGLSSAKNGTITIGVSGAAPGSITNTSGTNVITSTTGAVVLSTTNGSIGSVAGNAILTATDTLTANATVGEVSISNNGSLDLNASSAGQDQTFQLVTTNNGSINVVGNVSVTDSGANTSRINMTAGGSGNITRTGGFSLSAFRVNLASGTGNIGTLTTAINTTASQLSSSTTGGNSFVSNNAPAGTTTLVGTNSAANYV